MAERLGTYETEISNGLEGHDDNLDVLSTLFEQLQLATLEAADPHTDLITFATSSSVYYFGVITEHYIPVPAPLLESSDRAEKVIVCILFSCTLNAG